MTPAFPEFNSADGATFPVLSPSDLGHRNAISQHRFNLYNLWGFEDRLSVIFSYRRFGAWEVGASKTRFETQFYSMLVILTARHPFEVVKAIIRLVAVLMVGLISGRVRIWALEGEQHQVVNSPIVSPPVSIETNRKVSLFRYWLEYDFRPPVIFWIDRPNSTKITRFVTMKKARNWLPTLADHIGHNTTWSDVGQIPLYKESV